ALCASKPPRDPQRVVQRRRTGPRRQRRPQVADQGRVAAVAATQRLPRPRQQLLLGGRRRPVRGPLLQRRPLRFDPLQGVLPQRLEAVLPHAFLPRRGQRGAFVLVAQVIVQQRFQVVVTVQHAFAAILEVVGDLLVGGLLEQQRSAGGRLE